MHLRSAPVGASHDRPPESRPRLAIGYVLFDADDPNRHPKPPEPRRSSVGSLAYYLLSPNLDPVEYEPPEEVVMDESMWGVSILIFTWPMGALCSAALLFLLFLNICMQVLFIYL